MYAEFSEYELPVFPVKGVPPAWQMSGVCLPYRNRRIPRGLFRIPGEGTAIHSANGAFMRPNYEICGRIPPYKGWRCLLRFFPQDNRICSNRTKMAGMYQPNRHGQRFTLVFPALSIFSAGILLREILLLDNHHECRILSGCP